MNWNAAPSRREVPLAVVDEQHGPGAGEEDEVLVAVVVHVGEERLRRALEDRDAGRVGHVGEGAVAVVAEETVGQALGLGDVDVVLAVTVEIAHRQPVVPHAPLRHEEPVEVRGPFLLSRNELAAKGGVATERRLGRLGEDRGRGAAPQVVEGRPLRDAPGGVFAAPPAHLPAADPLRAPPSPGRAHEVEPHGRADERVLSPRHLDSRDEKLGRLHGFEVADQGRQLAAERSRVQGRLRGQRAGAEDLELRVVAEGDLVGGGQAAALELRGQQRVRGLGGVARALAQPRAQLAEAAGQLLGLLLLGKRVASGHEVLLRRLQRRRDAALGVVTVDPGRARSHAPCLGRGHATRDRTRGGGRGTEPRLDEGSCPRSGSIRSRSRL